MAPHHPQNKFSSTDNLLRFAKAASIASMGIATGVGFSYIALILPNVRTLSATTALNIWVGSARGAMSTSEQVSAIAISVLSGSYIYYKTKNRFFLYSSVLMASIFPYTFTFFIPINRALFSMHSTGLIDGTVHAKLDRWNTFQYGRVLMNFTSLLISLYGALPGHKH
ncbi:hypothetical protein BGZ94_008098 [Podila epigama]|nr:hypothetical protein BGZ94_008098 [Podila epigama]